MKSALLLVGYLACLASAQEVEAAAPTAPSPQLTLTYTATSTYFVYPTKTVHTKTVRATGTMTEKTPSVSEIVIFRRTTTSTTLQTSYVVVTEPAPSTTRIPTVKGFTPILAQSYYNAKIVVVNKTVTSAHTRTFDPSPTTVTHLFEVVYPSTITTTRYPKYGTQTYKFLSTTETRTYSRGPIESDFAACHPNNLAKYIPTGELIRSVHEDGPNVDHEAAQNPHDCCTLCQKTPGCYGGGFQTHPHFNFCYIFTTKKVNGTNLCNPRTIHPMFETLPLHKVHTPGDNFRPDYNYQYIAFNGPCGQIGWILNSATYFKDNIPDYKNDPQYT